VKVSAIVPVYNPGANIDGCIASLLDQSLPTDEYEAIFVDDGSTDDTPGRLDELAERHAHIRVAHIPNSGWPGRPRNVGIEMARGEYVYFIDNDDWIGREALERLYATAVRDQADVVVGKVVGHGRRTARPLFRRNRSGLGIDTPLLLGMLTPHKLFRRAFLEEHGIRFPEGRVRLEDHLFVVHAYLHTNRVSILADYPCYHWVRHGDGVNASTGQLEPVGYYQNLRDVLDLVDEHIEPGPLHDRLYAHWYRTKLLGRVGGAAFLRREAAYRHELYGEIRRLVLERFAESSERRLSFPLRARASLLRAGRLDALERLAEFEGGLRARVRLLHLESGANGAELRLEGGLASRGVPLRFVPRGERVLLAPPDDLASALPEARLDATKPLRGSKLDVLVRSTENGGEFVVPAQSELELRGTEADGETDGGLEPTLEAEAVIDPRTAAAGRPLGAGEWELLGRVTIAGFQAEVPIRHAATRYPLVLRVDPRGRVRVVGIRKAALRRQLARPVAGVRRVLRRSTAESASS
jgi:glycosyltransferase involved in cell wall biosynthesis